jgi:hypothetical protein
VRCASIVLAFVVLGCSSSDPAPATDPDSGVSPEASPEASTGDDSEADTPYSLAVVADTPLFYWRLNEGSGTTAADRTTNKIDGTYSAEGVMRKQPSLLGDKNASVRLSAGGSIDGSKDAKLAFVGTAAFSVECWISFPAPPVEIHTIFSRASETDGTGYSLWLDPTDGVKAYFGRYEKNSGATASTAVATPLVAGTTYHLVAVYDGAQLSIYVDGVAGEAKASNVALTDGGYAVHIGRSEDTTGKLSARVDEIALYPRALPKDRIEAHRDLGRAGSN